jgi:hypothetical protein
MSQSENWEFSAVVMPQISMDNQHYIGGSEPFSAILVTIPCRILWWWLGQTRPQRLIRLALCRLKLRLESVYRTRSHSAGNGQPRMPSHHGLLPRRHAG